MTNFKQNPAGRNTELHVVLTEPKIYGENADKYVERSFTQRDLEKDEVRELESVVRGNQTISIKFDHDVIRRGFDAALISVTIEDWKNGSVTYSGLNLSKMPAETLNMIKKIYETFRFLLRQCTHTWYVVGKIPTFPALKDGDFKPNRSWDGKTVVNYDYPLHPTECGNYLISPMPRR